MQKDLRANFPTLPIEIIGINESGLESGNLVVTEGRNLPWLQDVDANSNGSSDVWRESWHAEWRDIIFVDAKNEKFDVYNLTLNDLNDTQNYNTVRQKLIDATLVGSTPGWKNPTNALDVNNDTFVSPLDALLVLNELNSVGGHALTPPTAGTTPPPYIDVNGDNNVSPIDALLVINQLNTASSVAAVAASTQMLESAEGETNETELVGDETSASMRSAADLHQIAAAIDQFFATHDNRNHSVS